jgi:DHA3 family macrolide efflux protein-like MFS transporter
LAFLPLYVVLTIDVVTALLAVALLLPFSIPQLERDPTQQTSLWSDFVAGVRLVAAHDGLRWLYGVVTLMVVLIMPVFSLMPLFITTHFGGDVNQVALMQALGSIGLIGGGILAFVVKVQRKIVVLLCGYALGCGLIAAMALTPGTFFWLSAVCWALGAALFLAANSMLMAILYAQVPNQFQGRTFALLSTLMGLAAPLGLGLLAWLGALISVRDVFVIGGAAAAIVCLLGFAAPSLLKIEATPIAPEG